MISLRSITSCEVCGSDDLAPVLDLGMHPLCDDLIPIGSADRCSEYPIEILLCRRCVTAHQRFQVPKKILFPPGYHYRPRFTKDVMGGLQVLHQSIETMYGPFLNKRVLDIGCNDGSMLDFFKKTGAQTIGIEPTAAATEATTKGHCVYNAFLSKAIANKLVADHGKPDLIIMTNVFAHIEDLNEVLDSITTLLDQGSILIIENHYLEGIVENGQFDTFYHEHPRTYSYSSFVQISERLGLRIINLEFPSRYGGNIRVTMSRDHDVNFDGSEEQRILARERDLYEKFGGLNIILQNWMRNKSKELGTYVEKHGKIFAKAFPGRAAILIKLLGLDVAQVGAVYEQPDSLKVGYYVPGTRIPIVSDEQLFQLVDQPAYLLNFAWHIPSEISNYLRQKGYVGKVVNIMGSNDLC